VGFTPLGAQPVPGLGFQSYNDRAGHEVGTISENGSPLKLILNQSVLTKCHIVSSRNRPMEDGSRVLTVVRV
jgi:hypothetical protein